MPIYLKPNHDFDRFELFKSVLIVPCRFCPAASIAVRTEEAYINFPWHMLKTASYERYIEMMRSELEKRGVKADVFQSFMPHQFVMCMWTRSRRKSLLKRVEKYDALVVLGCEAAAQTIQDSIGAADCQVIQGMTSEGMMSILPRFQLPGCITLQLNSITPLIHQPECA